MALRDRTAEAVALPAPTQHEKRSRLEAELAVSLRALESTAANYEQRRSPLTI
jgi:hypothetical protein